ncbi:MAG: hypothetical protein H6Q90_2262 [Deltaproteobacteria bacterium]|nr:hypothetical protein [Deltaproteobacteria bacterium]
MRGKAFVLVLVLVVALGACGGSSSGGVDLTQPVVVDLDNPPPDKLSAYNLFTWDPATGLAFNESEQRIVPYDLNTPLFSDFALKQRAIYVPPGAAATFDPELAFEFPDGSVLIKNFSFPADFRAPEDNVTLVETRLLVRYPDGWHALPYIWDDAQQDAVLSPAGEVRLITFVDATGQTQMANYLIPQRNQCGSCHARKPTKETNPELVPIGIKARHLTRTYADGDDSYDQLGRLVEREMLDTASAVTPAYDFRPIEAGGVAAIPAADVERAARDYLDINCAHCHNPSGVQGITSQLFLDHATTDPFHLGVCKRPGSAAAGTGGFSFDVVPGDPDTSILYFRTHTTQVGAMMPLLGRSVTHTRGAELVHAWIAAMTPLVCSALQ